MILWSALLNRRRRGRPEVHDGGGVAGERGGAGLLGGALLHWGGGRESSAVAPFAVGARGGRAVAEGHVVWGLARVALVNDLQQRGLPLPLVSGILAVQVIQVLDPVRR